MSDKNLFYVELTFTCVKQPIERKCLFNYKNANSLTKSRIAATETDKFTKIFMNSEPFSLKKNIEDLNINQKRGFGT